MMTIGGLIAVLCGGCTLLSAGLLMGVASEGGGSGNLNALLFPLIIGGPPTILGIVLFNSGRTRLKSQRSPRKAPEAFD